jgi:hypothetical protein
MKPIERDQRLPSKRDWVTVSQSAADVVREGREDCDRALAGAPGLGVTITVIES